MKNNLQPLVSIGIASYNNSKYIIETLNSVANQTYKNIELIIVDDCSSDNSIFLIEDWLKSFAGKYIFIKNKKNIGIPGVMNVFLENLSGKYFFGFSSDDIMLPHKTKVQVEYLEKHPDIKMVYSRNHVIDDNGNFLFENKNSEVELVKETTLNELLTRNFNIINALTVMICTDVFKTVGKYDTKFPNEDFPMWLKIANHFKIHYLYSEVVVKYRQHDFSISKKINVYLWHFIIIKDFYINNPQSKSVRPNLWFLLKNYNAFPDKKLHFYFSWCELIMIKLNNTFFFNRLFHRVIYKKIHVE
jgi:glycosyltransferase involved in cell wall biosynthesis